MENETVPTTLMNKPVNDLTVKDAIVINVAILAVMAAIPAAIIGAAAVKNRIDKFRNDRKNRKLAEKFAPAEES